MPISQIKAGCERPLVVRLAEDRYAAVAEARLVDYAGMKLAPLAGVPHSLTAELGIGIILYVNHKALERQLDELLPLYHRWGVKGIKFGFVNVGSQRWTSWMHEAIRKAAEHQLMVDVHDEYRPTGWSRTYPNLMTQEGIRGDEERQPNTTSLTTLFTRMLAGPGDNTICYYDERVERQATHAYQLAKAVCFYSPWQFLFWYDRPFISREVTGRAPDAYNVIGDEPELEFLAQCPTVWDDTRVLHGSIGRYAVIARRSGDNWFIGAMNSDEPRSLDVPLEFLDAGRTYTAYIYSDDPTVATRTHVRIDRLTVDRCTVLKVAMPARGGQAIRLVPGKVPAGRVTDEPWAFWDFLPTAAELAGAELPGGFKPDGLPLVSFLLGGGAPKREYFYWELHERESLQAVRFGDWKAVRNGPSSPIELYDLKSDAGERENLAAEKPDLVAQAEALMKAARTEDPNWPLRDRPARRPRTMSGSQPVR